MRPGRLVVHVLLLPLAALVFASYGLGYSDGVGGSSGQVPEERRKCPEIGAPGPEDNYCIVDLALCGACHGDTRDMNVQEGTKPTPRDRIEVEFLVENIKDASELWQYVPGRTYHLDLKIHDQLDQRAPGEYAAGGFNLNASVGKLASTDPNVRITQTGSFKHAGSQNPAYRYPDGTPLGALEETEPGGEATHSAQGSKGRAWRMTWTPPADSRPPYGVAFKAVVMLPDGDGLHDCTRYNCSGSDPYAPQSTWDWYRPMTPRILCEQGRYSDREACRTAVIKAVTENRPPLNTRCEYNPDTCPTTSTPVGSPWPSAWTLLAGAGLLLAARRRRSLY